VAENHEDNLSGLVSELFLSFTAVSHDVVTGIGVPVGQPGVTGELPNVLDRVHLYCAKRQRHEGDGSRDVEPE
jgi:hypothetical protein